MLLEKMVCSLLIDVCSAIHLALGIPLCVKTVHQAAILQTSVGSRKCASKWKWFLLSLLGLWCSLYAFNELIKCSSEYIGGLQRAPSMDNRNATFLNCLLQTLCYEEMWLLVLPKPTQTSELWRCTGARDWEINVARRFTSATKNQKKLKKWRSAALSRNLSLILDTAPSRTTIGVSRSRIVAPPDLLVAKI